MSSGSSTVSPLPIINVTTPLSAVVGTLTVIDSAEGVTSIGSMPEKRTFTTRSRFRPEISRSLLAETGSGLYAANSGLSVSMAISTVAPLLRLSTKLPEVNPSGQVTVRDSAVCSSTPTVEATPGKVTLATTSRSFPVMTILSPLRRLEAGVAARSAGIFMPIVAITISTPDAGYIATVACAGVLSGRANVILFPSAFTSKSTSEPATVSVVTRSRSVPIRAITSPGFLPERSATEATAGATTVSSASE